MEALKQALKELPLVGVVFVTESGDWYFHKPQNIETVEYSRAEILGEAKPASHAEAQKEEVADSKDGELSLSDDAEAQKEEKKSKKI